MANVNRRLNQSLDLSQSVFDADKIADVNTTQFEDNQDYLKTERGHDDEPDYRKMTGRSSQVETESPAASEIRADYLEFLRQLFKVTERMDSGGLLLKYVFGEPDMDASDQVPEPSGPEKIQKFDLWITNLEIWGSFEPLNS